MKQYRTKYKDCIIEYMKNNEDHRLLFKDIYEALVEQGLNVNLVTVYRNLDNYHSRDSYKNIHFQKKIVCITNMQEKKSAIIIFTYYARDVVRLRI